MSVSSSSSSVASLLRTGGNRFAQAARVLHARPAGSSCTSSLATPTPVQTPPRARGTARLTRAHAAGPRPARGDHRAAGRHAVHVLGGRLEAGQPGQPPGRADHPAGLGLSRRRAGLLGAVLVPGAQPGPAARTQGSGDRPVPGRARTPRNQQRQPSNPSKLSAGAGARCTDRRPGRNQRLGTRHGWPAQIGCSGSFR